uniref:Uncharacterized protein n=1 Tax=Ditylenchus dipsaci TaxID=166011 RepID=A0A915E9F8_9BILA
MQLCEADKDAFVRSLASPVSDEIEDAISNGRDVDIPPPANKSSEYKKYYCMTCEVAKQSSRRSSDVFDSSDISLTFFDFKDENLPIFDNVETIK